MSREQKFRSDRNFLHGVERERRRGRHGAEGSWRGVSRCALVRPSTVTISRPLVSSESPSADLRGSSDGGGAPVDMPSRCGVAAALLMCSLAPLGRGGDGGRAVAGLSPEEDFHARNQPAIEHLQR